MQSIRMAARPTHAGFPNDHGAQGADPNAVAGNVTLAVPWTHLATRYAVLPFGPSIDRLMCEWLPFTAMGGRWRGWE